LNRKIDDFYEKNTKKQQKKAKKQQKKAKKRQKSTFLGGRPILLAYLRLQKSRLFCSFCHFRPRNKYIGNWPFFEKKVCSPEIAKNRVFLKLSPGSGGTFNL
jgi:hypothetical protein